MLYQYGVVELSRVIACCVFGANPLYLTTYQWDRYEQTSVKFESDCRCFSQYISFENGICNNTSI